MGALAGPDRGSSRATTGSLKSPPARTESPSSALVGRWMRGRGALHSEYSSDITPHDKDKSELSVDVVLRRPYPPGHQARTEEAFPMRHVAHMPPPLPPST